MYIYIYVHRFRYKIDNFDNVVSINLFIHIDVNIYSLLAIRSNCQVN